GENISAEHFNENVAFEAAQIKFHGLSAAGKIVYHQNAFVIELAYIGHDAMVFRIEKIHRSAAEYRRGFSYPDDALHPGQKRVVKTLLRLDVDRLKAVDGIQHER